MSDLDELIEHLLHDVALSGKFGLTAAHLENATRRFFDQKYATAATDAGLRTDHDLLFSELPPVRTTVDNALLDSVYGWLSNQPDVEIKDVREADATSGENELSSLRPATAAFHEKHAGKRLFTTEERMWQAITGHGVDHKQVPAREFEILCVIAAHGADGVLQPSVTKLTGQDKRSVPKRTGLLAEKGYIVKEHVAGLGTRTSALKLKRYATEHSLRPTLPRQNEHGDDAAPKSIVYYDHWFDTIMRLLKENNLLLALDDLRFHLGIESSGLEVRLLCRCVRRLAESGCVRRITARYQDPEGKDLTVSGTHSARFARTIQLLREPTNFDRVKFRQADVKDRNLTTEDWGQVEDESEYRSEDDAAASGDEGELVDVNDGKDDLELLKDRTPPSWTPTIPITNQIYKIVSCSGKKGVDATELAAQLAGPLFRRPLDEATARLTDVWKHSQPQHLRHLTVVRDSIVRRRVAPSRYRTASNLAGTMEAGEAILDGPDGQRTVDRTAQIIDMDKWGFPKIPLTELSMRDSVVKLAQGSRHLHQRAPRMSSGPKTPGLSSRPTSATDNEDHDSIETVGHNAPAAFREPAVLSTQKRDRSKMQSLDNEAQHPGQSPLQRLPMPVETPRKKRGPHLLKPLSERTAVPVWRKREVPKEEYEAYEIAAQAAAERKVMYEIKTFKKRNAAEAALDDSSDEPHKRARPSIEYDVVSMEALPHEQVAQVKADFIARTKPGVYINPPGARSLKLENYVKRGRPRAVLIAVFKSSRLREFTWYQEDRPHFAPKASQLKARVVESHSDGPPQKKQRRNDDEPRQAMTGKEGSSFPHLAEAREQRVEPRWETDLIMRSPLLTSITAPRLSMTLETDQEASSPVLPTNEKDPTQQQEVNKEITLSLEPLDTSPAQQPVATEGGARLSDATILDVQQATKTVPDPKSFKESRDGIEQLPEDATNGISLDNLRRQEEPVVAAAEHPISLPTIVDGPITGFVQAQHTETTFNDPSPEAVPTTVKRPASNAPIDASQEASPNPEHIENTTPDQQTEHREVVIDEISPEGSNGASTIPTASVPPAKSRNATELLLLSRPEYKSQLRNSQQQSAASQLKALRSQPGRKSSATWKKIAELEEQIQLERQVSASATRECVVTDLAMPNAPLSTTGRHGSASSKIEQPQKLFSKAYVLANPDEEFHHRGRGYYARGPRTTLPRTRGADAQVAADKVIQEALKSSALRNKPKPPKTGIQQDLSTGDGAATTAIAAQVPANSHNGQLIVEAQPLAVGNNTASLVSTPGQAILPHEGHATTADSAVTEDKDRRSQRQPSALQLQRTPSYRASFTPTTDRFDGAYVESHRNETFHHRGRGQWVRGLPPPGSNHRTAVRGPNAQGWSARLRRAATTGRPLKESSKTSVSTLRTNDRASQGVVTNLGMHKNSVSPLDQVASQGSSIKPRVSTSVENQPGIDAMRETDRDETPSIGVSGEKSLSHPERTVSQETVGKRCRTVPSTTALQSGSGLLIIRPYNNLATSQRSSEEVVSWPDAVVPYGNRATPSPGLRETTSRAPAKNDSIPDLVSGYVTGATGIDNHDEGLQTLETSTPIQNPLNSNPQAEVPINVGDDYSMQRKQIILDAVRSCHGVFPGNTEPWHVSVTVWSRIYNEAPDRLTIDNVVKSLVEAGYLTKLTFQFKSKRGSAVRRFILTERGIDTNSELVKRLQKEIISAYPAPHFPIGVDISDDIKEKFAVQSRGSRASVERSRAVKSQAESGFPRENGLTVQRTAEVAASADMKARELGFMDRHAWYTQMEKLAQDKKHLGRAKPKAPRRWHKRPADFDTDEDDGEDVDPAQTAMQGEIQIGAYQHDLSAAQQPINRGGRISKRVRFDDVVSQRFLLPAKKAVGSACNRMARPMSALRLFGGRYHGRDVEGGMTLDDIARHRREATSMLLNPKQYVHESTGTFGTFGAISVEEPLHQQPSHGRSLLDPHHDLDELDLQHRSSQLSTLESPENEEAQHSRNIDHSGGFSTPSAIVKLKVPNLMSLDSSANSTASRPMRLYRSRAKRSFEPMLEDRRVSDDGFEHRSESLQGGKARHATAVTERREITGRDRKSPAMFKDADRLVIAMALISAVCGGINQDRLSWTLIAHALSFRHEPEFLRRRWPNLRRDRKPEVERLRDALREPFLIAYEKDELPAIDFSNLNSTDWPALFNWAQHVVGAFKKQHDPQLPELFETREITARHHDIQGHDRLFELARDDYFSCSTDMNRKYLAMRYHHGSALPGQLKYTDNFQDDFLLAKSWLRAVAMTKLANYNVNSASAKVSLLGDETIRKISADMLASRMLQQDKKSRQSPGRNYQIHQDVLAPFRRWPGRPFEHRYLREVASSWLHINDHFQTHNEMTLPVTASDQAYVVFTNLVAQGMLKVASVLPDVDDDFDASYPRLSPWGYGPPGYETKKVDNSVLKFPISYTKTTLYRSNHDLKTDVPIPVQPNKVLGEMATRIPFWVDIHGNLIDDVWDMVLRSMLHLIVFRPGCTAVYMEKAHNHKFWVWEIDMVLEWMETVGIAQRCGAGKVVDGTWKGGWRAGEWWYCAFTPEITRWKIPLEVNAGERS